MLELDKLKTLCVVVEKGSLSAAARELHLTQSAVSQQIAALEREVGLQLLHRRPLRPTEDGCALLDHAGRILAQLRAAEKDLAALRDLETGTLRVGAFASACSRLLPSAIARFHVAHPGVRIVLGQFETEPAARALLLGELDLAVCFDYAGLETDVTYPLERIPLFSEPLDVAVPAGHRLAGEEDAPLSALVSEMWIEAPNAGVPLGVLARLADAENFGSRVTYLGEDFRAVLTLVGAGLGVAILPRLALAEPPYSVAVVRLRHTPIRRSVYACATRATRQPPAVAAFLKTLRDTGG